MKTIAVLAVIPMLLAGAAPALAQNREHQQMAAELRILQEQTQQLSVALAQALAQLTEAIKALDTRLDATDTAMRKSLADQKVIIDGVNTEMRTLRERMQDTNARIGTLSQEFEAMRQSLATPPAPVFGGDPLDPTAAIGGPPAPSVSRSGLSPTRLFDTAYSDFASGNYSLAISGFQAYLSEFPRFEKADDAQLHIGESYLAQKRYPEAIAAFTAVIKDYPAEDRVPEAYFRLGEAQRANGDTSAARTAWETIVARHADSSWATLAKQRLEGLPAARQP
jgi:tol-pal system protein YbgF